LVDDLNGFEDVSLSSKESVFDDVLDKRTQVPLTLMCEQVFVAEQLEPAFVRDVHRTRSSTRVTPGAYIPSAGADP
jgi:hypothetical protein